MAKLSEPPGKNDPFVKWFVVNIPQDGGPIALVPPPVPNGCDPIGYWSPTHVGRMGNTRACVKWVWHHGPDEHERNRILDQSLHSLLGAVHRLFDRKGWMMPDTASDKWLWEAIEKWVEVLKEESGP